MKGVMAKLGLDIPAFKLKRRVRIAIVEAQEQKKLLIEGVDHDGTPYSLFTQVDVTLNGSKLSLKKEPFSLFLCSAKGTPWYQLPVNQAVSDCVIALHFQGHYAEPPAQIVVPLKDLTQSFYTMDFHPLNPEPRVWENIVRVP